MQIRDRIKQFRRVPARELRPHPKNWRQHPAAQQNALRGVLAEIGYADALLVRELPGGGLQLIDGHLRAETTPDQQVPVLVLDVDETEAEKILATLDPLAAMAQTDTERLANLLTNVTTDNADLRQMLAALAADNREPPAAALEAPDRAIPEVFQVVVECSDEAQQRSLYERLNSEGFTCRVLTL